MLDHDMIRKIIEDTFREAKGVMKKIKLIREVVGPHVPGEMPVLNDEEHPAELFKLPPRRTRSGIEKPPVINKGVRIGMILCRTVVPEAGDRLKIGDKEFCIEQVGNMDHGANLLFEVWYQ